MEILKILFTMFVVLIIIFWVLTKSIITGGIKNLLLAIVLLMFVFIGTIVGLRVGNVIDNIQSSNAHVSSWMLLNSPVKFTEIVGVNYNGIWLRTVDEKLYFGRDPFNYGQTTTYTPKWEEITITPSNEPTVKKGESCPDIQEYPKEFPGEIAECALISWLHPGGGEKFYFALLKNGTLWEWHDPRVGGSDMLPSLSIGIGLLVGFLLGIFSGVLFLNILQKRYKITLTWLGDNTSH
ncbi:MAG TPA: hypothetical protein DIW23_12260 [Anaerolineae bacterium]|nr:hypothetical protein [Anaerolineae bacterium]